jgi:hypothetical protein
LIRRLLPPAYQAHIGRLLTSAPGRPFAPSHDLETGDSIPGCGSLLAEVPAG